MLINTFFLIWISSNFVVTLYYKGGATRFLPFLGLKMAKTRSKVVKITSDVVKTRSDVVRTRSDVVSFSVGFSGKNCDFNAKTSFSEKNTTFFVATKL